jgi:hypothetical protein
MSLAGNLECAASWHSLADLNAIAVDHHTHGRRFIEPLDAIEVVDFDSRWGKLVG